MLIQPVTPPIVQKYGGSSLSTPEKVRAVARKVIETAETGRPVVVVVSAQGNTTTELLEQAREMSPSPPARELDVLLSSGERMSMALLAMAIEEEGRSAISLTGPQCGILTTAHHTNASIQDVRPDRVARELSAGNIVIAAGYQGTAPSGEITTLGRGGSDTTAVALAAALRAERCEIYSDVAGVYTADPRIVEEPLHLEHVGARLMVEYARHGARVLHPECIDLARTHHVRLHALSTFGAGKKTIIAGDSETGPANPVTGEPMLVGVTSRKTRVRMVDADGEARSCERLLDGLTGQVDVLRGRTAAGRDYLVDVEDLPNPETFAESLERRLDGSSAVTTGLASVSVVGTGDLVRSLDERVLETLRGAGASVLATYRQPYSLTCAVPGAERRDCVRLLHEHLVEQPLAVGA